MSSTHRIVAAVRTFAGASAVGVLVTALSACSDIGPGNMPAIDSTTVFSRDVAVRVDPIRTYEYDFNTGPADSILTALWMSDLPIEEAWWPLNYLCADVRGPRLTVQLEGPRDAEMAEHDFEPGTGRLVCSQDLRQYVIGIPPGSFYVVGEVAFIPVEGGCWAIRVNDELRYEALGLPVAFREDGITVRALLILRDTLTTSCMVGRVAEVLAIETR